MGVDRARRRAPASRAGSAASCCVILAIVALIVLGFGIVKLIALPFGGIGAIAWFWGFLLVVVVLGVLALFGRRRQQTARAKAAEQRAAALGGRPLDSHFGRRRALEGRAAAPVLVARRGPRRRAARPRAPAGRRRARRGRPAGRAAARAARLSAAAPRRAPAGVAVPRHDHRRRWTSTAPAAARCRRDEPPAVAHLRHLRRRRLRGPDRAAARDGTRTALRLRFVDDLDYDGIADRLGCSPVAARQRVSTAVRTLRESFA